MSQSWRVTLSCTRQDAERLNEDIGPFALLDNPPTLNTSEPDPAKPEEWRLDAYFDEKPGKAIVDQLVGLVSGKPRPVVTLLPDEDWVTLSQAGLEPITEGRFHVRASHVAGATPRHAITFIIDAGRAFGTGQHATTAGCLAMIDRLAASGHVFRDILDLGTGTGVLAFAACRAFGGRTLATDIDPVSVEVAAANAMLNGLAMGRAPVQVELAVADGTRHRRIRGRAPYDLIIANILANPLIALAPDISPLLKPGGSLILAGLLDHQADAVAGAYRRHGLRLDDRIQRGEWPTLRLRKPIGRR